MLELLGAVWGLLSGLLLSVWGVVVLVGTFGLDVLGHVHADMPRLEGLLIGVALAWVLVRRDEHPLLRVLSSPLKLVLDILDLAWDQCREVVGDLKDTVVGWLRSGVGQVGEWLGAAWSKVMGGLGSVKDKLSKSGE